MIVKIETAYKIGNIVIQAKINPSKSPFCIQRHHHSNHQINQVYVPDLYSTNIRDNGLFFLAHTHICYKLKAYLVEFTAKHRKKSHFDSFVLLVKVILIFMLKKNVMLK
ncbi:hypothetical protein BpHYR1_008002 [Brachionus plicatilis]|uniref:Uncharacterized protein n=1 Tax=Brachionus plicatilis TaxID=10195 RepID=A0A3M7R391_BRAPC|nr:hypothetical protein BpHYR1_008002 [Brachionus plicatilis]